VQAEIDTLKVSGPTRGRNLNMVNTVLIFSGIVMVQKSAETYIIEERNGENSTVIGKFATIDEANEAARERWCGKSLDEQRGHQIIVIGEMDGEKGFDSDTEMYAPDLLIPFGIRVLRDNLTVMEALAYTLSKDMGMTPMETSLTMSAILDRDVPNNVASNYIRRAMKKLGE